MPPGKREAFQHDINVPLIVMGPGIAAGELTAPSVIINLDLYSHTDSPLPLSALGHSTTTWNLTNTGSTITQLSANYDLPVTWAELGAAPPDPAAAPRDGKSLVPLLHPTGAVGVDRVDADAASSSNFSSASPSVVWTRTMTLQEGYESCEAGHGEGKACSHKHLQSLRSRLLQDPTALALRGLSVYDDCWFGTGKVRGCSQCVGLVQIHTNKY
jgi:hypothetical protein